MDLGGYNGYTANADSGSWQQAQCNSYYSAPLSYDAPSWQQAQCNSCDQVPRSFMMQSPTPARSQDLADSGSAYGRPWRSDYGTNCQYWTAEEKHFSLHPPMYSSEWMTSSWDNGRADAGCLSATNDFTVETTFVPDGRAALKGDGNGWSATPMWQPHRLEVVEAGRIGGQPMHASPGDARNIAAKKETAKETKKALATARLATSKSSTQPSGQAGRIDGEQRHASPGDATSKASTTPPGTWKKECKTDPQQPIGDDDAPQLGTRAAAAKAKAEALEAMGPMRSLPDSSDDADSATESLGPQNLPEQVTHAITVQGPQQGLAMVTGRKQIESRSWKIGIGWIALHVGSQPLWTIGGEWCERMQKAWPEAPNENSLPSSKIVGLIHISEHRSISDCLPDNHPQAIWAVGPVCHIIDQAIRLPRPIPHLGNSGVWKIEAPIREKLLQQLWEVHTQIFEKLPLRARPGHAQVLAMKIDQQFVRLVIGPGGQHLRKIEESSGTRIRMNQTTHAQGYSTAKIFGTAENCEKASRMISVFMSKP